MPTVAAMNQIVLDLAEAFPEYEAEREIYLAPRIQVLASAMPTEIQVCSSGSDYKDHDGGVRREFFNVTVGIIRKFALDSGDRHAQALSDLSKSLLVIKETIIETLHGSFLTGNLLTRPLIIVKESPVEEKKDGILIQTLTFAGGLNVEW